MINPSSKFIVSVVPLVKIPLTRDQFFYYLSDEDLAIGTLVKMPLFRKSVEGIVIKSTADFPRLGNIKLKNVDSVLENIFFSDNQIELALFLSEYYYSSLGIILKSFK